MTPGSLQALTQSGKANRLPFNAAQNPFRQNDVVAMNFRQMVEMDIERAMIARRQRHNVAAIHIMRAHAATQRPQDMLRSRRVERHHLEINRVMPVARPADQQRYRLVSVTRQVKAHIDAY